MPNASAEIIDERDTSTQPVDPRLTTFAAFIEAVDRADSKAGITAARDLRAMGIGVVLVRASTSPRHEAPVSPYRG